MRASSSHSLELSQDSCSGVGSGPPARTAEFGRTIYETLVQQEHVRLGHCGGGELMRSRTAFLLAAPAVSLESNDINRPIADEAPNFKKFGTNPPRTPISERFWGQVKASSDLCFSKSN